MRSALFWLNVIALGILWPLAGYELYYRTYGWWTGADAARSNLAHSPLILLLLAVPVLAAGVLIANLLLRRSRLYWASSVLLLMGLAAFIWQPSDTLGSLTVSALGPGQRGDALLFNSAATGQVRTARTLLDAGARLRPDEGLAYIGATFGQVEVIKMGIARGEDINAAGSRGYTPLRSAIVNRQLEAVEFLLASGASPTLADKDGISMLRERRN